MPRTTVDLDRSVLDELRRLSRAEGKSMGALASEHLARSLHRSEGGEPSPDFEWRSWNLGKPLVDLDDKEALWSALDERG